MKILFVWTGLTSYMGDCWRELSGRNGIELKVVIVREERNARQVDFGADDVLRDIDSIIVDDDGLLPGLGNWNPGVMFVVGWHSKVCRGFVADRRFAGVPKVCCFDMPWRWKLRCIVAPVVLGAFLRHYKAAFVPGQVCERYARWLGFKKIHKGLFGIDTGRFCCQDGVAKSNTFVYIGRNSEEKRLDVLQEGYKRYKDKGGMFGLELYGKGLPGGFIAPKDVPRLFHSAVAFVLASDFDPWPLVLLEAMSAGCPIIASDRCTNRPELGKNWLIFKHGDADDLARALLRFDRLTQDSLLKVCEENVKLARQYDCKPWADKVISIAHEMIKE